MFALSVNGAVNTAMCQGRSFSRRSSRQARVNGRAAVSLPSSKHQNSERFQASYLHHKVARSGKSVATHAAMANMEPITHDDGSVSMFAEDTQIEWVPGYVQVGLLEYLLPQAAAEINSENEYVAFCGGSQGRLVVMMVTYTWCRPCMKFKRAYMHYAENYPGVQFCKVIANANEDLEQMISKFDIVGTPEFFFMREGEFKAHMRGPNKEKFVAALHSCLEDHEIPTDPCYTI